VPVDFEAKISSSSEAKISVVFRQYLGLEAMMKKTIGILVSALTLVVAALFPTSTSFSQTPVEVGQVNWNRDFEKAKAASKQTGKPLFVQFQEVPG